jgi:uncharacterized repeat protein (TIGR01451 family)
MPLETGLTPQDLAQALVGPGVTVSNVSFSGTIQSAGLFSGGLSTGLGLGRGVVLSSGSAVGAVGPNSNDFFGRTLDTPGDASLNGLVPGQTTYDSTVLEFDATISAPVLTVQYAFSSEEYDEYAGSGYNDVFGFFVNGVNIATFPGTSVPVSINTVNHFTRPEYFHRNDPTEFGYPTPYALQADGFTTVLQAEVSLPVGTHRLKLAIADVGDKNWDSWVFIAAEGIASGRTNVAVTAAASADRVAIGDEVVYTYTVTNQGADTATAIVLEDLVPAGLTVTSVETTRGVTANVAGTITAAIGSLGSGEQAVVSVKAVANRSGLFTHGARLRTAQQDTDPTNDLARVTTAVSASASPIRENSGGHQVVFTPVIQDPMNFLGGVTFGLAGIDASAFTIDPVRGAVTLVANPDYEGQPSYKFTVVATNTAGEAFNLPVTLPITDVDDTPPTVAISSDKSGLKLGQTATITFTLSEAATDFLLGDVIATGGTLSSFSGSGTSYSATFTPTSGFVGLGVVSVAAGRFSDAAGNFNATDAALSPAIGILTDGSLAAIIASRNGQPIDVLKAGQTATLTFTFSEPVLGFTASDVTVTGGTLSGFTGSDKTYTAVFTPRPKSITPGTVRIAANRYTDTLGNPNDLLQLSPSIAINTVVPAMTIAQRIPVLKAGQSTTVTFQIRGQVNPEAPFELSDISLAPNQGSVSSLTSLGVNRGVHTYTAVYTAPSGSFGGPVSLTVPANSFRVIGNDVNGNAAASLGINVDAQGPATVLSTTAQAIKIGQTATIDFTIANETANVVGFEAADISLSSGTISAPTRVPGTNIYRAIYTPAANVEGPVTIALAAGKFTDAIGNPNSLANSITIAVDTKAPAAPVVSLLSDTGSSSVDKITSFAQLQTTGTETGATVQYWTTSGLTTPWTAAAAVQGSNTVHVTQTDVAGNRSTATAFAFEYRTTGPAVTAITLPTASTGLVAGRFVELKVTFARPVFVTGDNTNRPFIQIGGFTTGEATRRAVYASGSGTSTLVFRYQVQAGDKALTGITYPASSITLEGATLLDAAGNAASLTFTLPTRRPVTRINA